MCAAARSPSVVARALSVCIKLYQRYLSPLKKGPTCRFEPTCSAYALDALRTRGACVGTMLILIRLSKCGPWHPGGYDPVPGTTCHTIQDGTTKEF